jgi:protein-S-isoprenylcysteine O-methyltransferase Ste14
MGLLKLLLFVLLYVAVVGLILFGVAGRADLPMFWAYLVVLAVPSLAATIAVYRNNPDLINEQRKPAENTQDKLTIPVFVVAFLAHWIIAALDVGRYHWSNTVPLALQIVGLIGFGCGYSLVAWSTVVNRFYSPAVRIQDDRGQQVITSGPYQYVRHPGYIGWILFYIFSGIALGSWVSVLPTLLVVALTIRRTMIEDAMLQGQLRGYTEYAQDVRYRLIPGVW